MVAVFVWKNGPVAREDNKIQLVSVQGQQLLT